MSDLLTIGRSGVLAYRDALSGISENVVNANNDGFARRQVTVKEQTSGSGPMYLYRNSASFNGVRATQVTRVWDQYRAANAWTANSDAAFTATRARYLGTVETTLDDGEAGVGVKLTGIFTTAAALAAHPEDATLRQSMIYAIGDAASAIGQTEANLGKVAGTIADSAMSLVGKTNDALRALARLNVALKTAPPGTAGRAALEDERDVLIGTVSDNLGVDVSFDSYGAVTLKLNDYAGAPLVATNADTASIVTVTKGADGQLTMTLTLDNQVSAASPTSGAIAGLVDSATLIADRRHQLDGLAKNLADTLNGWQFAGLKQDNTAGAALLTGTTAATLALATTDPAAIAAANGTPPDDVVANGNLLDLAGMRGSDGVEGTWHAMVADQSLRVASAKDQAATAATQRDSAYSALDDMSGVDLDAEAADLMRYQQAYSASAKIIQAARETLQAILDII